MNFNNWTLCTSYNISYRSATFECTLVTTSLLRFMVPDSSVELVMFCRENIETFDLGYRIEFPSGLVSINSYIDPVSMLKRRNELIGLRKELYERTR